MSNFINVGGIWYRPETRKGEAPGCFASRCLGRTNVLDLATGKDTWVVPDYRDLDDIEVNGIGLRPIYAYRKVGGTEFKVWERRQVADVDGWTSHPGYPGSRVRNVHLEMGSPAVVSMEVDNGNFHYIGHHTILHPWPT